MLADEHAHRNRCRGVPAEAKAVFAALALVAAFVARPGLAPVGLAVGLAALTVLGAGVPARAYARLASVPAGFLAVSAITLAVSVRGSDGAFPFALAIDPVQAQRAAAVASRSAAALASTLFLVLTTPMTDIVSLARRGRVPGVLVDLMTVCYRSLFVLSASVGEMRRAQAARLGYSSLPATLRCLGTAVGLLAVETWRRSILMQQASLARCGGGELRFLEPRRQRTGRAVGAAVAAGAALIALAAVLPGGFR